VKGLLGQLAGALGGAQKVIRTVSPAAPEASRLGSIQDAIAHHQAGRLQEADTIYRRILDVDPGNFDALHLSGLVCHQMGNSPQAIALISQAVLIQPTNALARGNLASVYLACNRLDDAEACLRQALTLKPDWDDGYNRMGVLFQVRGDADQAGTFFRKSLELNAANAEALNNLANIRRERGDFATAEELYKRTLTLRPDLAEAHNNLGGLYQRRGELDRAEQCYVQALALRPEDAESHNNLGTVFQQEGRLTEAEACFHKALEYKSEFAEALSNLGDVLQVLGRLDEAEAYCRSALALKPDYPEALSNLGAVLKGRGDLDAAEDCCRRALTLEPQYIGARINLGTILNERGQRAEAESCYRSALALDPDSATAQFNLSMLLLLRNDLEEGFRLYESRFKASTRAFKGSRGLHDRLKDHPSWQGEALSGKRVLVWTEQGKGDSIMMMRYLPMLKERGAKTVTVFCESPLLRIIAAMRGVDRVVCDATPDLEATFDLHCPIMSLPFLTQTGQGSVPHEVPYLVVPEDVREQWRTRLEGMSGIKVGLAWAGSKMLRDDAKRSIAPRELVPLANIDGVQLISLQKENDGVQPEILDWMDDCDDFMDTAGLIDNLDLIISVDTAVAHLGGALGKPTWLLNRFQSEWRWGVGRQDSDWYPSMRIFSQQQESDWRSVINVVAAELGLSATN
jgi:tetratricopeptide (TPR) repeat protein